MQRIMVVFNGGPHPDRDLARFRAACLKKFPAATEVDLGVLYRQAILAYDLPWRDRIFALFGEDIMTADLEAHPLWDLFGIANQRRLKSYPHDTGARITGESISERASSRMALLNPAIAATVNRSVLVSPSGMKESYVFSRRTKWTQEVREDDVALLRQHPQIWRKFHLFEQKGPLVIPRSYSKAHVRESVAARNADDIRHLVKEKTPSNHFSGVDVPDA